MGCTYLITRLNLLAQCFEVPGEEDHRSNVSAGGSVQLLCLQEKNCAEK
jgi:hypothetical protein